MRRALALVALAGALAGCGVKAQREPEILRSPVPPPTATPSSTERPTVAPTTTTPAPGSTASPTP